MNDDNLKDYNIDIDVQYYTNDYDEVINEQEETIQSESDILFE